MHKCCSNETHPCGGRSGEVLLGNCSQCKLALLNWSVEGSFTLKGKKIVDCNVDTVDDGADEVVDAAEDSAGWCK